MILNDAKMALSESRQEGNGGNESIFCILDPMIYFCLVTLVLLLFAY